MKIEINCERILSLLKSDYSDNELDDATQKEVNQHLEECPACRRIQENLEAVSLLLRNTSRVNPPESLWARIQADIRPERVPRIKLTENISAARFKYLFTKRNAFAFAAAAALVLAAVGFSFMTGRTNNGELTSSLTSLLENDEIREPSMNFGSDIEKYFL